MLFTSVRIYEKSKNTQYFRLHVTANSNSLSDQIIKLKVADKISKYLSSLKLKDLNKAQIKSKLSNNIYDILDISNDVLNLNNANYKSSANIGNIYYTKRAKKDINNSCTMSAGNYDSLNVILGEGKGENYWSLIYPYSYNAFCDIKILQEGLEEKSKGLIINNEFLLDKENENTISYDSFFKKIISKMFI